NVNLRLLQPAQKALAVVEGNSGILHAREPLSSFLADQLALPVLATIRVAVICIAHGYWRRRVPTQPSLPAPAERGPLGHTIGWGGNYSPKATTYCAQSARFAGRRRFRRSALARHDPQRVALAHQRGLVARGDDHPGKGFRIGGVEDATQVQAGDAR